MTRILLISCLVCALGWSRVLVAQDTTTPPDAPGDPAPADRAPDDAATPAPTAGDAVPSASVAPPVNSTRVRAGFIFGRNEGRQILETGNRQPDLFGFAGGSRLTYPRDVNYFGVGLTLERAMIRLDTRFRTTGWYHETGTARNEDFVLPTNSTQRENGFDTGQWSFRDSAYVFSGNRNFADAYGRSTMSGYDFEVTLRAYAAGIFDGDDSQTGLYFATTPRYNYFKYYVFDAIQFVGTSTTLSLTPIGPGNSFANAIVEVPLGAGYRWRFDRLALDASFYIVQGMNRARDHHIQRAINFKINTASGDGYLYRLGAEYDLNESFVLEVELYGHRYYSRGFLEAEGGLGSEALLVALSGQQQVWLSTKEAGFEARVSRRL